MFFFSCDNDLSFILFTFLTVHDEIKSRLHSGKTWYYLVKNLSSCSTSKIVKSNVSSSTCCTVSRGTWYRTLREEHKLSVWRARCWERYLVIRRRKWHDIEENCPVSSFPRQILSRWLNNGGWNWRGVWHAEKKCLQRFGGEVMVERDSFKNLGKDGRIILNWFYWNRMGRRGFESCRWR